MKRLVHSDVVRSGGTLAFKVVMLDDMGSPMQNPLPVSVTGTINRTTIVAALKTVVEGDDNMLIVLSIDDYLTTLV